MKRSEIWEKIELELRRAKKKFPDFPEHPAAKAGIVCEEAGDLMRACLQYKYERGISDDEKNDQISEMEKEAVQTAAMAIRFLENLNKPSEWQNDSQTPTNGKILV